MNVPDRKTLLELSVARLLEQRLQEKENAPAIDAIREVLRELGFIDGLRNYPNEPVTLVGEVAQIVREKRREEEAKKYHHLQKGVESPDDFVANHEPKNNSQQLLLNL